MGKVTFTNVRLQTPHVQPRLVILVRRLRSINTAALFIIRVHFWGTILHAGLGMREKVEWGSQKNTQILNRSELKTANRIVWNQQLNLTSSATSRAWRTAHDFSQTNGYSVYYKQSYIPFIPMTEYFQCSHSKTELPLPPPPTKNWQSAPTFTPCYRRQVRRFREFEIIWLQTGVEVRCPKGFHPLSLQAQILKQATKRTLKKNLFSRVEPR